MFAKLKVVFLWSRKFNVAQRALIAHANEMNAPRSRFSELTVMLTLVSLYYFTQCAAELLIFGGNTVQLPSVQVVNDSHESATI